MTQLLEAVAKHGFSGVVRLDRDGRTEVAEAFGDADRAAGLPTTVDTTFGLASVCKGFTAIVAVGLVVDGRWSLDTRVRPLLGDDLPEVPDDVTVEHLLAHRSGIGDYVDEDDDEAEVTDYVLTVPVHRLVATEDYLPALAGNPPSFPVGARFGYCNSGFVVLALLVERLTGTPFHDLVTARVLEPARMTRTAYLRSDELPGGVAHGYLESDGLRTNVLHLPVRGNGDGGVYSTVEDLARFWRAFAGRTARPSLVGGGDDAAPQRRARGGAALRPGLLARRRHRRRPARGVRRRGVRPHLPRPHGRPHLVGGEQRQRRRVADREPARGAPQGLTGAGPVPRRRRKGIGG